MVFCVPTVLFVVLFFIAECVMPVCVHAIAVIADISCVSFFLFQVVGCFFGFDGFRDSRGCQP